MWVIMDHKLLECTNEQRAEKHKNEHEEKDRANAKLENKIKGRNLKNVCNFCSSYSTGWRHSTIPFQLDRNKNYPLINETC